VDFSQSYLGQLRAQVGARPLLAVGARVLIEDASGRFLLVRRTDNGLWGLPGGAMELGESLMDVVHREAHEEAHARLRDVTAFGISSDPQVEQHIYPNGDRVHTVEVSEIRFAHLDEVDRARFVATEYPTFGHWRRFVETGCFQVV